MVRKSQILKSRSAHIIEGQLPNFRTNWQYKMNDSMKHGARVLFPLMN